MCYEVKFIILCSIKDIIEEWITGDGAITKYNHENGEKIKQKGEFDFLYGHFYNKQQ